FFFFSSRGRHTGSKRDCSSDVCSSDLPTQIAYEVPVGRKRIAYPRPPMLIAPPMKKMTVGHSLVNPSDLPRAVAHTASKLPETIKTTHAIDKRSSRPASSCRWPGTTRLVRCAGRTISGQGRGRTADLPLFRRTLVPTELPGRNRGTRHAYTQSGLRLP